MNIGNSTLSEIAEELKGAGKKVALFPHENMDGDALGSCIALAHVLESMGNDCGIIVSEDIPGNLMFLDYDDELKNYKFCTRDMKGYASCDISILIDSGELKRIPKREECFLGAKKKICIDHHATTEPFCDLNYIDPESAATGQLIFELIKILIEKESNRVNLDSRVKSKIADAIFTAITTDTGDFQYSNTQKLSHQIVAELYDWGLDANKVSIEIYANNRLERLKVSAEVISKAELLCDGKVALAYCSQEMLRSTGAKMEETEWIASDLRGIQGVEVAIFLKEEQSRIKVSLRSKRYYDVASLAKEFGGGGHVRASGYNRSCTLDEAINEIKDRITKDNSI